MNLDALVNLQRLDLSCNQIRKIGESVSIVLFSPSVMLVHKRKFVTFGESTMAGLEIKFNRKS